MRKNGILFLSLFAFFSGGIFFVPLVQAENLDIIINEIAAYERTDCEWVEIYNRGSQSVDMQDWKFWEGTTNHGLTISSSSAQTNWIIESGEYAIITQKDEKLFGSECGNYTIPVGTVFDSSWSTLNESGEEIGLKDSNGNFIEKFTYVSAPNFSLQRQDTASSDYSNANWLEHTSSNSFGKVNEFGASPPPEDEASGNNTSTGGSSNSGSGNNFFDPKPVIVAKPTPIISKSKIVSLNELFPNPYGADNTEFIELKNASDAAVDLKDWRLLSGSNTEYVFSTTTIEGGKTLLLKRAITKIALRNDKETLKLYDASDKLIDETSYTEAAGVNWSWSMGKNSKWNWTTVATPAAENSMVNVNRAPEIIVDFVKEGNVGEVLHFDASDSTDQNGDTLNFDWDFGDGGVAAGEMSQHVYFKAGTYKVNLSVGDSKVTSTKQITIKIKPQIGAGQIVSNNATHNSSTSTSPKEDEKGKKSAVIKGIKIVGKRNTSLGEIKNLPIGTKVSVSGAVAVEPGIFGTQYFYIVNPSAEESSGVQVYMSKKDFPLLKIGDLVSVNGEISMASGEKRIKVKQRADIDVSSDTVELTPVEIELGGIDKNWNGGLVSVSGMITQMLSGYWYLDDGTDEIRITFKNKIGFDKNTFKNGDRVEVVGILRNINDEWEILPRKTSDIAAAFEFKNEEMKNKSNLDKVMGVLNGELGKYLLFTATALSFILGGLAIKIWGADLLVSTKEKIISTISIIKKIKDK